MHHPPLTKGFLGPSQWLGISEHPVSSPVLRVETVPSDPKPPPCKGAIPLRPPANENGVARSLGAKVLIPKDLPVTQTEIEVFALLLDDLISLAANDNEGQPR